MENEQQSESRQTEYYCSQGGKVLCDNLYEWNRFQHIADLLNPTVCEVYRAVSKNVVSVSKSLVLASALPGCEVFYTAAYLVLCLIDNGMNKAADMLARSCIMNTFRPILFTTHQNSGCDPVIEPSLESEYERFSRVVQCHEKIAESFWKRNCKTGLINVLNVFFKTIEENSWAWSTRYTWNMAPWINKSFSPGSRGMEMNSKVNLVTLVAPAAMILGLLCVVLPLDIEKTSSIEQVI